MKITAVVRTHNRKEFLKECLCSISLQSYSNWEILIFDDGGDEDNYKVYRDFKESHQDKRVVYLTSATNFDLFKKSWTYPIHLSEGEIIIRIDDDDVFEIDAFTYVAEVYESNPQLDFSYGSSASFSDDEKRLIGTLYNTSPLDHKTRSAWGPYVDPINKHWMWFENYFEEDIPLTSIIHASRKAIMTVYHPYVMRKSSLLKLDDLENPTSNFFDDLEFLSTLEYLGFTYAVLKKILIFTRDHNNERIMSWSGISHGTNLYEESNRVRELVDQIRPNNFLPSIREISSKLLEIEDVEKILDQTQMLIESKVTQIFGIDPLSKNSKDS